MNHGESFWRLRDKVTNNNPKELRKKFRNIDVPYKLLIKTQAPNQPLTILTYDELESLLSNKRFGMMICT
jgi:hypothetical protein